MASQKTLLLNNASATGSSVDCRGEYCIFYAYGTFAGATLALQYEADDGAGLNYVPCNNLQNAAATLTAPGMHVMQLPAAKYRVSVASGTPSGLFAALHSLPQP